MGINFGKSPTTRQQQSSVGVGQTRQLGLNTSATAPAEITPEYAALRDPIAAAVQSVLAGQPQYQGPVVAPITGAEEAVLQGLQTEGQPRQSLLNKTLQGGFLPGQAGANPFLDAVIRAAQEPTRQAIEDTVARTLPTLFGAQGGQVLRPGAQDLRDTGSSPFAYAAARAVGEGSRALGDIATNIAYPAYEAERGRQQAAVPLSQQEVQTTISNLQAQALPRLIQDLGVERGLALFSQNLQALLQGLQIAAGLPTAPQGQVATSQGLQIGTGDQYQTSQGTSRTSGGFKFGLNLPIAPR